MAGRRGAGWSHAAWGIWPLLFGAILCGGMGACKGEPNDVPPGGCSGDAECPASGCARGVCIAGTCETAPDDGGCKVQKNCDAQRCEMMGTTGECVAFVVVDAINDDRCCPEGLSIDEDNDCAATFCGNETLNVGEECDDGNTDTEVCGYGLMTCEVCDSSCRLVAGEIAFCGDGDTDAPYEECDDDNNIADDGCENDCTASTPDPIVKVTGPGFVGTTSFAASRRDGNVVIIYDAPGGQGDRLFVCEGLVSYTCVALTSGSGPDHTVLDLAIDPNGNVHVLWHDGSFVRYMVLDDANNLTGDVSTGVQDAGPQAIASTGHALLVTLQQLLPADMDLLDDLYFVDLTTTSHTLLVAADASDIDPPGFDPEISDNGSVVAYASSYPVIAGDLNGVSDVFIQLSPASVGPVECVSVSDDEQEADGSSRRPSASANGLFVAFETTATNLYNGDGNGLRDIAVRNRMNASTERVSIGNGNVEGDAACTEPSISADGRFIAFRSQSTTFDADVLGSVDNLFVRDRNGAQTVLLTVGYDGSPASAASSAGRITPDGQLVVFTSAASNLVAGDTDGTSNVFVAYNALAR